MIQVLIAEVELDNIDEFGIELGLQDSLLFDRSLLSAIETITTTTQTSDPSGITTQTEQTIVSAENTPGFNFTDQPAGQQRRRQGPGQLADMVGGQGISNFGVGRINSELGFGGLVLSASSESVSVLIRALQECRRLDVLSRPQVMTLDNQPAFIQVGQRVPRIIGTTINETGQVNNIQMENVGLILGVTPRISPDGMVVMEIDAEKSELGSQLEGIPVSISDGQIIKSPIVNVTTAQTTVSAASGETIVLGGLITKSARSIHRRVPWLSDIPLLGLLFRYDSTTQKRTELLIIMTPWVVRGPEEAERVKRREAARMNWCLGDVNSIHGDTGLYDLGNDASYAGRTPPAVYPDMDGPATQGAADAQRPARHGPAVRTNPDAAARKRAHASPHALADADARANAGRPQPPSDAGAGADSTRRQAGRRGRIRTAGLEQSGPSAGLPGPINPHRFAAISEVSVIPNPANAVGGRLCRDLTPGP